MRDRLSHLSFDEAARMLGTGGRRLLVRGGALDRPAPDALRIDDASARVDWADGASAALVFDPMMRRGLRLACTICRGGACLHAAGLLSLVLEHKSDLGLAAPPPDGAFAAGEKELVEEALREREERAAKERMSIVSAQPDAPWTDYRVTSAVSGKTYRVALRGDARGVSYCSCPDFKINTLGTCKHVMKVLARATKRFPAAIRARAYRRKRITIHVRYDAQPALAIALPAKLDDRARRVLERLPRGDLDAPALVAALRELEAGGHAFFVTPDAEELLDRRLVAARLSALVTEVRAAPAKHRLPRGQAARSSRTRWASARPSRASASPSSSLAKSGSRGCS